MLKLMIGVKGTGKTKALIDNANAAIAVSKGNVVCIEKGTQLRFNVKPNVRLINTEEYRIHDAETLYGFIAGVLASNYDVTDVFVDHSLKICNGNMAAFEVLLADLSELLKSRDVNVFMTASLAVEDATDAIKAYC